MFAGDENKQALSNFFGSVFIGKLSPHPSRVNGPQDGDQGLKHLPL